MEAPTQHPELRGLAIVYLVDSSDGLQPSRSTSSARSPSTFTGSARRQGGIEAARRAVPPLDRGPGHRQRRPAAFEIHQDGTIALDPHQLGAVAGWHRRSTPSSSAA
jgi:hypothetical protein